MGKIANALRWWFCGDDKVEKTVTKTKATTRIGSCEISTSGGSIIIKNNRVWRNGKLVGNFEDCAEREIYISINGDVDKLIVDTGNVTVNGNAGGVTTNCGDVEIAGDVSGNVSTDCGNVSCGNVDGDVTTDCGNIRHTRCK